jgi:hypothetical protein
MEWSVFVQCAMNSAFIIIGGEFDEDLTQVGLSEHDQVVDVCVPKTWSVLIQGRNRVT